MDLFNLPFFRSYEAELGWVIRTTKHVEEIVKNWQSALKSTVEEILADHPEYIQNWMLEDGAVTREKLAHGTSDFIDIRYNDVRVDTQSGGRTTVYYAIIPREYKPSLHIANNMVDTVELAADQALDTFATVSVNAGLFDTATSETRGFVIQDGVMRNSDVYINNATGSASLYMTDDGKLHTLAETATAADAMATGAEWMVRGWYPIVENGIYVAGGHLDDAYFPRSWIAQDESGNYLVGVCGGYEVNKGDRGMNLRDIYHFCMYDAGFIPYFLYNLDGGASSSLTVNGVRVNRVEGSTERSVANTIQFVKPDAAKIENASRTGYATARALGRIYKYLYDFVQPQMEIKNEAPYVGDLTSDLDTFFTPGMYQCGTGVAHWPSSDYGFLWVTRRGRLINQFVHSKDGIWNRELYLNTDQDAVMNVLEWTSNRPTYGTPDYSVSTTTWNGDPLCVIRKQAGLVTVTFTGRLTSNLTDYGVLFKLPDGYRPYNIVYATGRYGTTDIKLYINNAGNVATRTAVTSGNDVAFTVTFAKYPLEYT